VNCTRVVSVTARLSVEPDVLAVLWESLDAGRVREVPAASRKEGRFIELEGAPDLVVEVVSDSSHLRPRARRLRRVAGRGRWRMRFAFPRLPLPAAAAGDPRLALHLRARAGRRVVARLPAGIRGCILPRTR
jgi:hypothetical protein